MECVSRISFNFLRFIFIFQFNYLFLIGRRYWEIWLFILPIYLCFCYFTFYCCICPKRSTILLCFKTRPFFYYTGFYLILKEKYFFKNFIFEEHASDISSALCYFVPGLARLLLPRINSLSLLSLISSVCAIFVHWFRSEFYWVDSAAALTLSIVVFSSLMPLSTFTGKILLQTTPPHVQNQIDRLFVYFFMKIPFPNF